MKKGPKIDLIFLTQIYLIHERLFCSHYSKMCFQLLALVYTVTIWSLNSEGSTFRSRSFRTRL